MFRIRQYTDFSSPDFNVSSTIHVHLLAIMSKPSTERNSAMPLPAFFVGPWLLAEQPEILMQWFAFVGLLHWKLNWTPWNFLWFLLEPAKHHTSLVTHTAHVHREFEHHVPCHNPALRETAPCRYQPFLSILGCLLNSRKFWHSGLLLSAFFSGDCTEGRETSFGFCWGKQNTTLHWWHPRPMYTAIWAPRSMSQPSNEGNSAMPLPAFFVGRWLLAEQPEILMQWFAVIGLFRGTCAERRETSLGFMLGQATQRHRHLSTMFHVTTQHRGKQHTRLRTIFWFTKSCPSGLLCVRKALNQRVPAGGQQPIFLCCPTKRWKMWWKGSWTHEPVPALAMGSG